MKQIERRPTLVVWAREFAKKDRSVDGFHAQIIQKISEIGVQIRNLKEKRPTTDIQAQFNEAFLHHFNREKRQLQRLHLLFRRHFEISD